MQAPPTSPHIKALHIHNREPSLLHGIRINPRVGKALLVTVLGWGENGIDSVAAAVDPELGTRAKVAQGLLDEDAGEEDEAV